MSTVQRPVYYNAYSDLKSGKTFGSGTAIYIATPSFYEDRMSLIKLSSATVELPVFMPTLSDWSSYVEQAYRILVERHGDPTHTKKFRSMFDLFFGSSVIGKDGSTAKGSRASTTSVFDLPPCELSTTFVSARLDKDKYPTSLFDKSSSELSVLWWATVGLNASPSALTTTTTTDGIDQREKQMTVQTRCKVIWELADGKIISRVLTYRLAKAFHQYFSKYFDEHTDPLRSRLHEVARNAFEGFPIGAEIASMLDYFLPCSGGSTTVAGEIPLPFFLNEHSPIDGSYHCVDSVEKARDVDFWARRAHIWRDWMDQILSTPPSTSLGGPASWRTWLPAGKVDVAVTCGNAELTRLRMARYDAEPTLLTDGYHVEESFSTKCAHLVSLVDEKVLSEDPRMRTDVSNVDRPADRMLLYIPPNTLPNRHVAEDYSSPLAYRTREPESLLTPMEEAVYSSTQFEARYGRGASWYQDIVEGNDPTPADGSRIYKSPLHIAEVNGVYVKMGKEVLSEFVVVALEDGVIIPLPLAPILAFHQDKVEKHKGVYPEIANRTDMESMNKYALKANRKFIVKRTVVAATPAAMTTVQALHTVRPDQYKY